MDIAIIVEPRSATSVTAVARDAVDELQRQLGGLGWTVATVHTAAGVPGMLDDLAAAVHGAARVAVVDARTVLHTSALRALLIDQRVSSGLLVDASATPADPARTVRIDRGVAVAIGSPLTAVTGDATSVGVCLVATGTSSPLDRARALLVDQVRADRLAVALDEAPVEVLAAAVLASGELLSAVDVRRLVAVRAGDESDVTAARARRDEVDEERAWLDAAVKAQDGFFTTFFVSPYSRFVARWAARRGLTPNQVTVAALALGLLSAGLFATGQRGPAVAGAVALQLSFAADCVDGQLARYTQRFSAFGAWLDAMFDRTKEYVVFAGLAFGAARHGDPGVWGLAGAALVLQVVRHALDFGFGADRPAPRPAADAVTALTSSGAGRAVPLTAEEPPPEQDPATRPSRALAAAGRAERVAALRWAKRIVAFPIGERFAVISLTAAVATPRLTFVVLLAWGAVAGAYTAFGRLVRARRW